MSTFSKFRIVVLAAALAFLIGIQVPKLQAAAGDVPLRGYAWSDNVGWVSFSCENTSSCATVNYGVIIDAAGKLSGYAWSDNVGWISFTSADLAGCPSGTCEARYRADQSQLTGWARALSYQDPENGGWAGWMSLSGTNYNVSVDGVTGNLAGYSWSDQIIGWLSFNCSNVGGCGVPYKVYALFPDIPMVETKANGSIGSVTIYQGQSATLSWNVQNVTSCTPSSSPADPAWNSHAITLPSGSFVVSPSQTTTYTLTCTGPRGSVSSSVIVYVSGEAPPAIDMKVNGTTGQIVIAEGQSAIISWNISADVTSCTPSSLPVDSTWNNNPIWSNPANYLPSGSLQVSPTQSTTYTLTCHGPGGDIVGSVSIVVSVAPAVPPYFNLEATPSSVPVTFPEGGGTVCSDVTVKVIDYLGYNESVALSVSDWGGLTASSSSFTPATLTQPQYSTGSNFHVCLNSGIQQGIYSVWLRGAGASKEDTARVLFNVLRASPTWKEI